MLDIKTQLKLLKSMARRKFCGSVTVELKGYLRLTPVG
jgi:hypothetical protein